MTRLTPSQSQHLRKIQAQRRKYDRQQTKTQELRQHLDDMLIEGRELGISTHRLATASRLSQPRVQQLTTEPLTENTPAVTGEL